MIYKVRDCFEVAEIDEDFLVIPRGEQTTANPCVLVFNETGAFLWPFLKKGGTISQLSEKLCHKYEISTEQAIADVKELLKKMKKTGLLELE